MSLKSGWVTVIKGTWWTDEGDVFHPKGLHHYDGAKDEEAIVQIMGMGPVETIQTEVDATGRPVSGR